MRGRSISGGRGSVVGKPRSESTAETLTIPAPYKGWNAIGNLASMDPLQAVQMDNIFPDIQYVTIRKGCINWAGPAAANIHALLPYNGTSSNKLFASTNTGIYDVTASGAIGALQSPTVTNGYWKSLMISTSGGTFMFCVNGVDSAVYFDGTNWTVSAITGVSSNTINYVTLHKSRIWMVQQNSMNLWYLGADSIAGAASQFPVGALFKRGGHVVAIGTYTIQYYYGPDDFFIVVTSNGEIAVYQGTDPSSSTTWSLVGIYDVPAPLGNDPIIKFGVDVLYLSQAGLLPLSKLQQAAQNDVVVDRSSNISYVIEGAFLDAAQEYSGNLGWNMQLHKTANLLIVNIPVSTDTQSYQFVMNTTTKAWCRFTGWNAACWAELAGDLYFAGGTQVSKAWTGITDAGSPIIGTVIQAYNPMGMKGMQSSISLVRPLFGVLGSAAITMALDNDFQTFNGQTQITYQPVTTGGIWDVGLWDTAIWSGSIASYQPAWQTVPNNPGYMHAFRMQVSTSQGAFTWTATDYAVRPAGIL